MTRSDHISEIEAALADLSRDETPLDPAFRARLLADAAATTVRPRRRWGRLPELIGLAGLPAAALVGVWLGLANPSLVLMATPWEVASDDGALLDDVFGGAWVSLDAEVAE